MLRKIAVALTLCMAQAIAQGADLPAYPFIHVQGSGMRYALPDVGEIDFEASVIDADPEQARVLLEARLAAVKALLATHAIAEDDFTVRDVRRDIPKGQPLPDTYRLKASVRIKVRTLASWGKVVTGLLAMPNLDEFAVAFDITDRSKIEAELTAAALKNARTRATDIAAGVGRKLGPASGVSTGEVRNLSRMMGLAASESPLRSKSGADQVGDRNALSTINIIELRQTVDVLYSMK